MAGVFQNIDPPPPSPPGECVLPRLWCGGRTHSLGGEGGGRSIFWKTSDTALYSTYVTTSWSAALTCWRFKTDTSSQSVLLSRWRSASARRPVSSSLAVSCARSASTCPSLAFRLTISIFVYSTPSNRVTPSLGIKSVTGQRKTFA